MKFWKIDDLIHENEHIYYNKKYRGNLYLGDEIKYETYPIRFIVEMSATSREIKNIEIDGSPNYPTIDLRNKILEYIMEII